MVLSGLTAPAGRAARAYSVAPPPAWVDAVAPPDAAGDDARDARDGVLDLLEDGQVRVTAGSVERYARRVQKALTAAGVENVSQVQIEFDPTEESLVLHAIAIRRGAAALDALRTASVSVIQPERELDERIYSGMLEAVVVLEDVRPGDVVDLSYSLVGRGDGFGGRFADAFALGEPYPVRRVRWRLLWPEGRRLFSRARNVEVEPTVRRAGGAVEYVWLRERARAVDVDDDAPAWFDPTPVVEVSEYETWAEVAAWAAPLYRPPAALPDELARQVEAWRAAFESPEQRLAAAARFVQDEIRYTGIELGPGSYRPADPATVLARRYGDCKDKSLLLATALAALGVDAAPALVHFDRGRALPEAQPSPLAFDHCIVRAETGGRVYWIDPTIQLQRGDLARHANPDYGHALVVRAGTEALEAIGSAPGGGEPATSVSEVYTLEGEGARLESVETYTGAAADEIRYLLAQTSLEDLGADGVAWYGGAFGAVEAEGLPEVSDDEAANRVRVAERYRIAGFWEDGARTLTADRVAEVLSSPRGARRAGPIAVDHPVDVAQTIEVRGAAPIDVDEASTAYEDEATRFSYRAASADGALRLEFRYRTLADHVSESRAVEHRALARKMRKRLDYTLRREDVGATGPAGFALFAAPILGVGALAAAALAFARRRQNRAR